MVQTKKGRGERGRGSRGVEAVHEHIERGGMGNGERRDRGGRGEEGKRAREESRPTGCCQVTVGRGLEEMLILRCTRT